MAGWILLRMESRHIRLVHKSSMAVVLLSIVYVLSGIVVAGAGEAALHIYTMTGGALGAFVVAVESSYTVSPLRAKKHPLMPAALAGLVFSPLAAAASVPLGYLAGPRAWAASLAVANAVEALPALVAASLSRGAVRASMAAAGYTNASTAAYLALYLAAPGSAPGLLWAGVGYVLVHPVQMIYSVTLNAFPSTYGRRPLYPLLPVPFALATLGAGLILAGPQYYAAGTLVGALSTLVYLPAVRFHEAPRIWREILQSRRPPVVVATHKYFLEGHVFVAIAAAYATALAALAYTGLPVRPTCIAHAMAVAFSGLHILIHGPMMLPVILGIPTARRYTPLPYAILAAAPPAACLDHRLLGPLVLLALLGATYIVVDLKTLESTGR